MLFRTIEPLVLASGSPRRRELLSSLGLEFEVRPSPVEPPPELEEQPHDYAMRAAAAKASDVAGQLGQEFAGATIIGGDSVVVAAGRILGKPADEAEAMAMLELLCGGERPLTHQVVTGMCIRSAADGGRESRFFVSTDVTMTPQPEEVRKAYVATGEPMDKAGAYAIQGLGAFLVREICGSYSNVVGLPLAEVVEVLGNWGVIVTRQG